MPLDQVTRQAKRLKVPALAKAEITALTEAAAPEIVRITRPRMRKATIPIVGISPYVQHAFSEKQRKQMEETQRAGQQARGKRTRNPKDFNEVYESAKHVAKDGWLGIPAPAFRNAMISACKLVGIVMTRAKLSVFIEADGIDEKDGMPLVRIIGEPRIHESFVRLANGSTDIRWRPMWEEWSANVPVTWDEDQFSATDVMNLMLRAGLQVGIGEGRPDSPDSNGLGWGRFEVAGQ
jgi:hypothetical protein